MITVIIATLNRPRLLHKLLESLLLQSMVPDEIIISDSSDLNLRIDISKFKDLKIRYLISDIKSAAQQRNMALELVNDSTKYLAILDDDIRIEKDYMKKCISLISETNSIGISGITSPISKRNGSWLAYLFRLMFLLDSRKECSITASGINVPIKSTPGVHKIANSEWLFGCSVWKYESISDLRFPKNFIGQSLFEDVIFSIRASRRGKLSVSTEIEIVNEQSLISRPSNKEFYRMWVSNRFEVIREIKGNLLNYLAYHWTNLGKLTFLLLKIILNPKRNTESIIGFVYGYFDIFQKIRE